MARRHRITPAILRYDRSMRHRCLAATVLLGCAELIEGVGPAGTTDAGKTTTDGSSTAMDSTTDPHDTPPPAAPCETPENVTEIGVVGASTIFSGYPPILAVDGDVASSWFSTGPEPGPTVFSWQVGRGATEACITEILLVGNADHNNPIFREDHGFETVTIVLLTDNLEVVLMEQHSLAGTPDPDLTVPIDNILAHRLELHFDGHEDPDAGGFAELEVLGTAH
jgi:hypothetical protein